MTIIALEDVCIIFGSNVDDALALADRGATRSQIQAETNLVLGVHNCTLNIEEGEILVLMGLSGSGKSTLLRAINRLNPISRGRVLVREGERAIDVGKADRGTLRHLRTELVSMVFQQFGLLPWRTVEENVAFGLEISGMGKEERLAKAREQLELVGLQDWSKRKVGELSGGMQQRVGLARAFATGAPILLMDEPFSALDTMTRDRMSIELQRIWMATRKSALFITHSIAEAVFLSDRIVVMSARPGRIIREVTVNLPRPRTLATLTDPEFTRLCGELRELFDQLVQFD